MTRRRPVPVGLVAAACLLTIACGSGGNSGRTATSRPPGPTASGANAATGMILYRDGLGDIVALDVQTGEKFRRKVDHNTEVIIAAECTGDGSRIALLRQDFSQISRQIVVLGENAPPAPLVITAQAQGVTWSPEGDKLLFTAYQPKTGYDVVIVDPATGAQQKIAGGAGFAGSPRWSPDGSRVAFHEQVNNANRVVVHEIAAASMESPPVTKDDLNAYDPDWSPDGKSLVVASSSRDNSFQIYRVNLDGGDARPMTTSDIFKRLPRYSPDGLAIAFTGSIVIPQVSPANAARHQFGVFLLDPDGSNERPLTVDPRLNPGAGVDPYLDAMLMGWCRRGAWLDSGWSKE